ncbi:MAG: fused MFS/spermidine synthase, partial [candidate division NC10 bacterium]|nr:fused MFS/spermidine synthase [candidate division NC10 bacterium]
LLCFFLSGATGLVYEVVWLRLLGLVFGHTVYAITTVLAAFMAGLALGSFAFARVVGRLSNLLRAYGWLEIGIGLSCAAIPALLGGAATLYLRLHGALDLSYDAFSLVQFLLVFALLLLPTALMGGTLPVLSQALAGPPGRLGRTIGVLYAVNTAGAVVGVVLAGYVLLPAIGNRATIAVAVGANLAVGAVALFLSRSRPFAPPEPGSPPAAPQAARAAGAPLPGPLGLAAALTVAALGLSGAASMIYEVAWTRALSLVIGSSTYAFTAMLVAFLVGIAGGSAAYSWLRGTRPAGPATFAVLQAGIGLAVALVLLLFERMPELFLVALRWSDSPGFVQGVQFAVSAGALLLPTLLIGATFPCAVAVAARGAGRTGQDVGHIYAVNTVGAIVGTVLAGFVLIPALGVHAALKVGILLNLLLAAGLWGLSPHAAATWRWGGLAAAVLAALGAALVPPWDQRVMASGPAIYGKAYLEPSAQSVGKRLREQRLLYYRDGLSATVSVNQRGQHVFLRVNGKAEAGTAYDMPTQLMLGHLPLLLHPKPQRVLVIGLGSGITAGAVARHPIERLDIAEIEPAVVEASRFFAHEHGEVLADPRVRLVLADARTFLLTTAERYDVIISEPSNPWIGGLASLFSVEFFTLARERLRPGGIMLQWLQAYNLFPDDLRMVLQTFRTVFPGTSVWNTHGDFLILGRTEPGPVDFALVKARYQANPALRRDLERIGVPASPGVLGFFMLGEKDAARLAEGAGLNTDDRLPLEFSAPRALYVDTTNINWKMVHRFKAAELPEVTPAGRQELERPEARYAIGMALLNRNVYGDALFHFQKALERDPGHTLSLLRASVIYLKVGRPKEALDLAERARPHPGPAAPLVQTRQQSLKPPRRVGWLRRGRSTPTSRPAEGSSGPSGVRLWRGRRVSRCGGSPRRGRSRCAS